MDDPKCDWTTDGLPLKLDLLMMWPVYDFNFLACWITLFFFSILEPPDLMDNSTSCSKLSSNLCN